MLEVFSKKNIDYEETIASAVQPTSARILLALATILSRFVHQGDVNRAILNSNLDKSVYMRPRKDIKMPHESCPMVIRVLYGLIQYTTETHTPANKAIVEKSVNPGDASPLTVCDLDAC